VNKAQPFLSWLFLLGLVSTILWIATASTFVSIGAQEDVYERKLSLLTRLKSLPEKEDQIRQRLEDLGVRAAEKYLYQGNHSSVQALIQRDLRQLAVEEEVRVQSMRTLANVRQSGLLRHTSVQVRLQSVSYDTLAAYLAKIESRQPLLRVRTISVRVQQHSTAFRAAQLVVVLEVVGYRKPEGAL